MSASARVTPATRAEWVQPRHGKVVWDFKERGWLHTRYADVSALLRSPAFQVSEVSRHVSRVAERSGRDYGSLVNLTAGVIGHRNAPFHPIGRRFLKACLAQAQPQLSSEALLSVAKLEITAALERGRVDAVREFGTRVPMIATTRALGFSPAVGELAFASGHVIEVWRRGMPLRELDRLEQEARVVEAALLDELAAAGRSGSGILARIVDLNRAQFGFSDQEMAGLLLFLLLAGFETTMALFASALFLLLSNPTEAAKLDADPSLIDGAVTESLRYIPPLWRPNYRIAAEPVSLAGRDFEPGDVAVAHIEQAHFDPEAYPDPQRFDISRRGPSVLAFAAGAHACLGAAVARLEARTVLGAVLATTRLRLVNPQPEWQEHPVFRRLARLDLIVAPRS